MRYCHKDIWKSERNVVCGMASHTGKIDMIRGSIIKSAALFALPICVGNILQQLYGTVDTLVVGNFCDSAALAAVAVLHWRQPLNVVWCVAFYAYINRFQIQPEERILRQKFGAPFQQYCQQVHRWLGHSRA